MQLVTNSMSLPTQKISKAYTAFLSKLESSAFSPLKIRGIIERVVENKRGHLEGFKEIRTTSIAALAVILLIGIVGSLSENGILIPARRFAKREASLNRREKVLTQSMWAVDLDSEILAHERLTRAHLQQAVYYQGRLAKFRREKNSLDGKLYERDEMDAVKDLIGDDF
ncbi:hypothetical protein GYMLUDRAFT_65385 [Collybiopsis luxurians FD-317 M1]|uniref:Uncharacterized protein n=1 Tax=Collybiopsis luxurians FD-317 M1 TaxID=944289 RepID=A0A0D0C632_9AGAR|nr:hypothetical protein GYMLUDRAFT_65385 [Collybiopsis luxurians FD-317 M1]